MNRHIIQSVRRSIEAHEAVLGEVEKEQPSPIAVAQLQRIRHLLTKAAEDLGQYAAERTDVPVVAR